MYIQKYALSMKLFSGYWWYLELGIYIKSIKSIPGAYQSIIWDIPAVHEV
jgi:hypothetical protein